MTLKYFCAVCREGSFLGASKKLDYAQPNLSARIAQLEKKLGCTLLTRRRDGVVPTGKGFVLLEYAEKILRLAEKAKTAVQTGQTGEKHLVIGSMESTALTLLPTLLKAYHSVSPETQVSVKTGTSAAIIQKVLQGEFDGTFAAGGVIHAKLTSLPVKTEKLVLVSSSTLEAVTLTDLLQQPLLVFPYGCFYRHVLETLLTGQNIDMASIGALVASISAGLGISLLPESAINAFSATDMLAIHQAPEPYSYAEVRFIYRKDAGNNEQLQRFIETIQVWKG